jgi:hypothetical protein
MAPDSFDGDAPQARHPLVEYCTIKQGGTSKGINEWDKHVLVLSLSLI